MWCADELGLSHKRIDAGLTYGVVNSASYLAMNPNGTVPTIQDGDQTPMFESGAIIRYLAAAYGDKNFWPQAPNQRAPSGKQSEPLKNGKTQLRLSKQSMPLRRTSR